MLNFMLCIFYHNKKKTAKKDLEGFPLRILFLSEKSKKWRWVLI